jgi:hypothetical protein
MIGLSPFARSGAGVRGSLPAVVVALALAIGPVRAQDAVEMPPAAETPAAGVALALAPVALVPVEGEPAAPAPTPADTNAAAAPDANPVLPLIVRDPFWPPGFDPNLPVVDAEAPPVETPTPSGPPPVSLPDPGPADWAAAARQIKPRVGRSVDPEGKEVYFALLNNRLLAIGQKVSASTSLFACSWRVGGITAAGVELIPAEARRLSDGKRFPPPKRETD